MPFGRSLSSAQIYVTSSFISWSKLSSTWSVEGTIYSPVIKFGGGSFPKCPELLEFNFADIIFRVGIRQARFNLVFAVPYAIGAPQKSALIFSNIFWQK